MRGKVLQKRVMKNLGRITPAYAGKSLQVNRYRSLTGDHPRVCGEKEPMFQFALPASGSPPRMRGKDYINHCVETGEGITPAYAGKRIEVSLTVSYVQGSPPRMRGKASVSTSTSVEPGITPAYAGKSACTQIIVTHGGDHPRVCGEKSLLDERRERQVGSPPRMRGKDCKEAKK